MKKLPVTPKPQTWYRKELAGAMASNGSPYNVTFKKGTVNKLLVFFIGGGASWNEETAMQPMSLSAMLMKKDCYYIPYLPNVQLGLLHVGFLSPKADRNPFKDWHILTLPYSTADFHLGNNKFNYQNTKTLHHSGAKNVDKALEFLKTVVPNDIDNLVIAGVSAGGFGCAAHAPKIATMFPRCENIVVYVEGSYLKFDQWPAVAKNVWQVEKELLAAIVSDDMIADLLTYANDKMPKITTFLHALTVWDDTLIKFMNKMKYDKLAITDEGRMYFHDNLIKTVATLKNKIPNYHYYLTDYGKKKNGTTAHMFSSSAKLLYGKLEDDTSIADWVTRAIDKQPFNVGQKFLQHATKED